MLSYRERDSSFRFDPLLAHGFNRGAYEKHEGSLPHLTSPTQKHPLKYNDQNRASSLW